MALNGNNILIYLNGTAIAGTTSNEMQSSIDTIEIGAPLSSGTWKQFLTKQKTWTVNTNFLVLQDSGVRNLLNVGTTYTLKFRGRSSYDSTGVSGSAILKSCKITAIKGNLVKGSFQFQGNNALS